MSTIPIISVLIPTREKSWLLKKSILALGNSVNIEILLYVDNDDNQIGIYEEIASSDKRIALIVGKRFGYKRLHKCYNILAKASSGKWLMIWNDDAMMETDDWVELIDRNHTLTPIVLNFWSEEKNIFPVVNREFYEALGCLSHSLFTDRWIQKIGVALGIQKNIPEVSFSYFRDDKFIKNGLFREFRKLHDEAKAKFLANDIELIRRKL